MDEELRNYLETTLRAMEIRFVTHVDAVEARLRDHIDSVEARSREHTEIVETRLLSEFWKWARTADARYRQNQAIVGALDARMEAVEDRVADLERRFPL